MVQRQAPAVDLIDGKCWARYVVFAAEAFGQTTHKGRLARADISE